IAGCIRNGVPEDVANQIYDEMISFASYAFNKSHAAAYAVVAAQTAWLKRYHPAPFMAAMLNSVYGNPGKIAGYIQHCRAKGIDILPPDVNHSGWKFTVQKDADGQQRIRFGLGAVKTVGQGAVQAIMAERDAKGPYKDIFDFCRRIDPSVCNKRAVENLIRAGAFDSTGALRPQMLAVFESAMDANISQRKQNVDGQLSLFDMAFGGEEPIFEEHRAMPNLPDFPLRTRLAMEKEVSGVYITGHPLDDYRDILAELPFSTADLEGLEEREDGGMLLDGRAVDMGGILTEVKGKATKKGAYMGFVTLEDLTGQIECLVFPKVYERYQGMMAADDLVVLCGKLSIREEESPKLLVDRVVPLEEWKSQPAEHPAPKAAPQPHRQPAPQLTDAQAAQQAKRKLFIKLERPMMDRVTTLLSLHPGSVPVYLHIPEEKITLLAPRLNWCDATEDCLKRLRTFLGEENVKLTEAK
ncbi:MAG: hypothetical protein IJW85_03220, partial [Clostridia bacterium]|nr:hypothetical protein [Clostridia bacterium]